MSPATITTLPDAFVLYYRNEVLLLLNRMRNTLAIDGDYVDAYRAFEAIESRAHELKQIALDLAERSVRPRDDAPDVTQAAVRHADQALSTHCVTTIFGDFFLCAHCEAMGHMGPRIAVARLSLRDATACQCNYSGHTEKGQS